MAGSRLDAPGPVGSRRIRRALRGLALVCCGLALSAGPSRSHETLHHKLERLNARIAREPANADLVLVRAGLYRAHEAYAEALQDIERAAQLAPDRLDLDFLRGRIHLDAGCPDRAEALLRRFLAREPEHPGARAARARALFELGRPLEAAADWSVAIDRAAMPSPEHYHGRARALAAAGPEHLDAAIRGLDRGLARLGPVTTLELFALDLEVRLGRFDAALARLDRLAARSPRQESWLARRGEILEWAGRRAEAAACFDRVLSELSKLPLQRRRTQAMRGLADQAREAIARLRRGGRSPAEVAHR